MIKVTKLNGEEFMLNALMVEQIQSFPDTTVTLTNGKKIVVNTSENELVHKITNYYQLIGLIGIEQKRVSK